MVLKKNSINSKIELDYYNEKKLGDSECESIYRITKICLSIINLLFFGSW